MTTRMPRVARKRKIGMKMVYHRGGTELQKVSVMQQAPREESQLQQERPPLQVVYSQACICYNFRLQQRYNRMFDEAEEYLNCFLELHGLEGGEREEEEEGMENVSGYFNVPSEEKEEKEKEEQGKDEMQVKEEWKWSQMSSSCSLLILKLTFVLFFLLLLANHHFNQSNPQFLPFSSDFDLNKLH